MDICPAVLEKHLILNSHRFETYPEVMLATRDGVEQMRRKSDPMDLVDVVELVGDDCEGQCWKTCTQWAAPREILRPRERGSERHCNRI